MAEFRTRFGLGDVVYILNKDCRNPEPVVISDIRIHAANYHSDVVYGVSYRGITDARQKDFKEQELGTLMEAKKLFLETHPEELEPIEPIETFRSADLPSKGVTQEEREHFKSYPPQFRP